MRTGTAPLIVFATVLVLWDLALAIAAIMDALNRIHEEAHRAGSSRLIAVLHGRGSS